MLIDIIKNKLGFSPEPKLCTFLVTWWCNCKCEMCDIWKKEKSADELSLAEIKEIFKDLHLDMLRITGGEPFLRPDLAEIFNSAPAKIIHITSNGLLGQRMIDFLHNIKNPEKLHLKISIDAYGENHNKIRGVNNAFNTVVNNLQTLTDLKNTYHFYLGVNQTIVNQEGIKDYFKLYKLCEDLGIKLHTNTAYKKTALYIDENLNFMPSEQNQFECYHEFSHDDLSELMKIFDESAKNLKEFKEKVAKKYYIKGLKNRLLYKKNSPNPPCAALNNHLRILPNGNVPICLFNSTIIGNLKKEKIKELWQSEKINNVRKIIKKCPGCWAGCEVVPSAAYSGDIIKGLF